MTSRRTTRVLNLAAAVALALAPVVALVPSAYGAPAAVTATTTTAGVDAAVRALEAGESVYVDPAASDLISETDAESLRQQVKDTGYPFYISVLPRTAAVNGSSQATLEAIFAGMGRQAGTYAVYLGDATTSAFKAGDTSTPISTLATVAYRDNKDQGAYAVISSFVTAAAPVVTGSGTGGGSGGGVIDPGGSTEDSSGSGIPILAVLGVGGAAVAGGAFYVSRKNKKANAERTAAVQKTVFEDVTAYGEDVARLDVDDPRLDDAGRADAQAALDAYEVAKMKVATMARPEDAAQVTTALEGGRFAMACV